MLQVGQAGELEHHVGDRRESQRRERWDVEAEQSAAFLASVAVAEVHDDGACLYPVRHVVASADAADGTGLDPARQQHPRNY